EPDHVGACLEGHLQGVGRGQTTNFDHQGHGRYRRTGRERPGLDRQPPLVEILAFTARRTLVASTLLAICCAQPRPQGCPPRAGVKPIVAAYTMRETNLHPDGESVAPSASRCPCGPRLAGLPLAAR